MYWIFLEKVETLNQLQRDKKFGGPESGFRVARRGGKDEFTISSPASIEDWRIGAGLTMTVGERRFWIEHKETK